MSMSSSMSLNHCIYTFVDISSFRSWFLSSFSRYFYREMSFRKCVCVFVLSLPLFVGFRVYVLGSI